MNIITNKALLKLDTLILIIEYLEERLFCFTTITGNNKEINKEEKMIFDLEEEIKIKKTLYKEMKDTRA